MADKIITEQSNNPNGDKGVGIFKSAMSALRGGNRITPSNISGQGTGTSSTLPPATQKDHIENTQQQFLDWQVSKINENIYTRTLYYDTDRIASYQDFRAMDMSPEIAAALDILRDECLAADTVIPLLSGEKVTIEELYKRKESNFYVYGCNPETKEFEASICDRVVYKGEQDVYKVTFDDDSFVEATSEHLWLNRRDEKYTKTIDLKEGHSVASMYCKTSSDQDRINGYEMILENGKWVYTHRVVKKTLWNEQKGVVHHKNFDKLNNDPSNLQVMGWFDHQNLHASLNSYRWKNDKEYSDKMRKVFSETNSADGKYWSDPEWRANRQEQMSKNRKAKYSSWTKEQLLENFSRSGEENGMFGKGELLSGDKNGRYRNDLNRDFTSQDIIDSYLKFKNINKIAIDLGTNAYVLRKSEAYKSLGINRIEDIDFIVQNISFESISAVCKKQAPFMILEKSMGCICEEMGWSYKKLDSFLRSNGTNWSKTVKPFKSKSQILNRLKRSLISSEGSVNFSKICREDGFNYRQIETILKSTDYKNMKGFAKAANHSVVSVEFIGKKKTYDLVNSGNYNNFVVNTSNGTGIVSHNCLTRGENGKILQIYSQNGRIQTALEDLFNKRLNMNYNARMILRDLMKFGDFYMHLHIAKGDGIYDFKVLSGEEISRIPPLSGEESQSEKFRWETMGMDFEFWQVAHFRLLEDSKRLPYGRSILDSARKLWKQLQLAEDAMLVYRLVRAPERRVFYIEVGNLEEQDVEQFMMGLQNQLKKQPMVNQNNGNTNYRYDPLNVTEDYFIPIRDQKMSKIETLPGASNLGEIQDIEYLEKKLFASLKVPKTYLNYTENLPGGSTLSQADLRFARTVNSIQEAFLMELRRIASIHLHFLGFSEEDLEDFDLKLNNPSSQQELLKLETMKARVEVFKEYFTPDATSPVSYTWAMENLLGFSKSDIKLLLKQKKIEKRLFAEIDAAVETYKKIGLFTDIDAIYELPNADEIISGGAEGAEGGEGDDFSGGGGGGSSLGGGFGGAEDLGLGDAGGEDLGDGVDLPAGEELPDDTPDEISEIRKMRRNQRLANNRTDSLLNELLGVDEEEIITETVEDEFQDQFDSQQKTFGDAKKLLDSLERRVDVSDVNEIMNAYDQGKNPLLTKHDILVKKSQMLINEIEELSNEEEEGDVEEINVDE